MNDPTEVFPDAAPEAPEEPPIIIPEVADNHDETRDRLMNIYTRYKNHRSRLEKQEHWRKDYFAYLGVKVHEQQYRMREVFRQIETLIPQICKVVLDAEEKFVFTARQEGFDEDANGTTAIVHDQLQRFGSIEQLYMWIEHDIKFGTSYIMPRWCKFKQTRYKFTPMHAEGEKDEWDRETMEIPMEAPYLEFIPVWDVYTHPDIEEIRLSPMVVVRKGASVDDIKTRIREGELDAKACEEALKMSPGSFSGDSDWNGRYNRESDFNTSESESVHELLYFYSFDGMQYVVLDGGSGGGGTIVRGCPSDDGEIPIVDLRNYPQAREHYGMSEIRTIIDAERILNELVEMYVKQHWYDLPIYQVTPANKDAFTMSTRKPGGHIVLKDPTQPITMLPTNGTTGTDNLSRGMATILNHMKETSGISDELAGTAGNSGTATGIVKLQAAAGDRIQHKIARLIPSLKRVYAWMYNLNARHLNQAYRLRIQGNDGLVEHKTFSPEIFGADIDVNIEIGGGQGLEQANAMLNAYKVMGQDPLVNRFEIVKEYFRSAGSRRPKRFTVSNQDQQSDALAEGAGLMQTGIIADPKPIDDHPTHLQIHQMQMQQLMAAGLTPDVMARMQNHLAIHQMYVTQQQQAQAQAQQAQMQQGNQAQGVGQQANARTEGMFQNGQRGAAQMGA